MSKLTIQPKYPRFGTVAGLRFAIVGMLLGVVLPGVIDEVAKVEAAETAETDGAVAGSEGQGAQGKQSPADAAEAAPGVTPDESDQFGEEASEALVLAAMAPWTGDLDGMIERRMIRVLTVLNKTFYFVDRGAQYGTAFELLRKFEEDLNKKLKLGKHKVHVVFIPVSNDRLFSGLVEGVGDIAVAGLTITDERKRLVDFSDPLYSDVREVLVTGKDAAPIASIDDLAGREVVVRQASSYHESLLALNERFRTAGTPEVKVTLADEVLEDEDLIEMVNAGLYPATVVDEPVARFWAQIFEGITVHDGVALRTGGQIAWAFRKDSPELQKTVNGFVKSHKKGTEFGNIILKRYLKNTKFAKNAIAPAEIEKFNHTVELFKKHAGEYDFDWLLIAAQAYQESGIDQSVRSRAGAVGVMQVLPTTAAGSPINISNVEADVGNNIHAGVKYLRFMVNDYFDDPAISPVDRHLLAFAGYNAGPNRIDRLRKKAAQQGLDPNKWFQNVELVVANEIGRETTQYVGNIYKYYIAYKLASEQRAARDAAKGEAK